MSSDIDKIAKILPVTSDSKWNFSHWQWWFENWLYGGRGIKIYHYVYEDPDDHEEGPAMSIYFPLLMKGDITTPDGKNIHAGEYLHGNLHYTVNVHGWKAQDWDLDNTKTALENVLGRAFDREDVFIPTLDMC